MLSQAESVEHGRTRECTGRCDLCRLANRVSLRRWGRPTRLADKGLAEAQATVQKEEKRKTRSVILAPLGSIEKQLSWLGLPVAALGKMPQPLNRAEYDSN